MNQKEKTHGKREWVKKGSSEPCWNGETMSFNCLQAAQHPLLLTEMQWLYSEVCTIQIDTISQWKNAKSDRPRFRRDRPWIRQHPWSTNQECKTDPRTYLRGPINKPKCLNRGQRRQSPTPSQIWHRGFMNKAKSVQRGPRRQTPIPGFRRNGLGIKQQPKIRSKKGNFDRSLIFRRWSMVKASGLKEGPRWQNPTQLYFAETNRRYSRCQLWAKDGRRILLRHFMSDPYIVPLSPYARAMQFQDCSPVVIGLPI